MNTKIIKTETLLHLNLEIFLIYKYMFFFFHLFLFFSFFFLFSPLSASLMPVQLTVDLLISTLSLPVYIFKTFLLFVLFSSTCLFVFPFFFNFFAFHLLSPFHSTYHIVIITS
jgi:hypothetical protein